MEVFTAEKVRKGDPQLYRESTRKHSRKVAKWKCEVKMGSTVFRVFLRLFSRSFAIYMTAFSLFFSAQPHGYACPLCKEAVEKIGHVWTSMGFNWSIYLMLAVPFLLVGSFAAVLYFQYRKRHST